jgi:thiol-disulfide isomerase/thioredoxin
MNKLKLLTNLILLFVTTISNAQNIILYKNYQGKVYSKKAYDSLKTAQYNKFKDKLPGYEIVEDFYEKIQNKDSLIITYRWHVTNDVEGTTTQIKKINSLRDKEFPIQDAMTLEGKKLSIDDLKGKPTLINLWFTSCAPCIEEMPVLNRMKEKYGDKFNFLAITHESKSLVDKFLKIKDFKFTHIVDSKKLTTDLGFKSMPVNLFLDKNGVLKRVEGNVPYKVGKDGKVIKDKDGNFVSTEGELFIEILESYL